MALYSSARAISSHWFEHIHCKAWAGPISGISSGPRSGFRSWDCSNWSKTRGSLIGQWYCVTGSIWDMWTGPNTSHLQALRGQNLKVLELYRETGESRFASLIDYFQAITNPICHFLQTFAAAPTFASAFAKLKFFWTLPMRREVLASSEVARGDKVCQSEKFRREHIWVGNGTLTCSCSGQGPSQMVEL